MRTSRLLTIAAAAIIPPACAVQEHPFASHRDKPLISYDEAEIFGTKQEDGSIEVEEGPPPR